MDLMEGSSPKRLKPESPQLTAAMEQKQEFQSTYDIGNTSNGVLKPEDSVSLARLPEYVQPIPAPMISTKVEHIVIEDVSKSRLYILVGKPGSYLSEFMRLTRDTSDATVDVDSLALLDRADFTHVSICIQYDTEFVPNLELLQTNMVLLMTSASEVSYHIVFDENKKWEQYSELEKTTYKNFLEELAKCAGDKVVQCSLIHKYNRDTVYITEKDALANLGQEIQGDIDHWKNLRIFDYGLNCIRLLPGVRFPESLEQLNLGGGAFSLATLAGFRMPQNLKILTAAQGLLTSIDHVSFPLGLQSLDLAGNRIYFLGYVEFPPRLEQLDISQNRIESLKNVNFPRNLKTLSVAMNPIECIKGARFPETLEHLDLSCIPNESMTGIKLPDLAIYLNLQLSMTNTRGLKIPSLVKELNLGGNGVNSINPLKLPNLIEKLYLANNNIKTLNKVAFPTALRELYLGNNMVTTLKNVLFPPTLEVLDLEMDPDYDEHEKYITSLKDVILPQNLRVLRLGYHLIKSVESMEFPYHLEELSLRYNDLRVFRNVRFGPKLRVLDLLGNQELIGIDNVFFPESLVEVKIPPILLNNLPATIVERANRRELVITKSAPFPI